MGRYVRKDRFYQKAKEQGLPSRASFKIEEIIQKFSFVKKGSRVLDLGAAPGGWTVILSRTIGPQGHIWGIDRLPLKDVGGANISFFQGDIFGEETQSWLDLELKGKKLDAICSDLSPNISGIYFKDALASVELAQKSLSLCQKYLTMGGNWVAKVFPGKEFQEFDQEVRANFGRRKIFEPQSTRKSSKEIYVLGLKFKGPGCQQPPPKE